MDSDAQETAKRTELNKRLEEIVGRKLDMTDEQLLAALRPIASSTYLAKHDEDDDAWITSERFISPQPIAANGRLLDTSGLSVTGSNGQLVFRLRNFLGARDEIAQFFEPINLLAMPQGTSPFFMTMNHKFIQDPDPMIPYYTDVEIMASTWNPDGTAAANVRFYWRCRVAADTIIGG
jgi:hypothetical protein